MVGSVPAGTPIASCSTRPCRRAGERVAAAALMRNVSDLSFPSAASMYVQGTGDDAIFDELAAARCAAKDRCENVAGFGPRRRVGAARQRGPARLEHDHLWVVWIDLELRERSECLPCEREKLFGKRRFLPALAAERHAPTLDVRIVLARREFEAGRRPTHGEQQEFVADRRQVRPAWRLNPRRDG